MTFSVNLNALRGLPQSLDRRAHDLSTASSYVGGNTILEYGSGLADIFKRHERNVDVVMSYLNAAAHQYAEADAGRLRQAIANYAGADARAASRYDATLPRPLSPTPSGAVSTHLGPEVFKDRADATAILVTPTDHHSDYPYRPSWYDLLSPTSMLRDAVWKLTSVAAHLGILDRPYDPFEFFVEPYIGDWAGILRCAEVFDHVAGFLGNESEDLGYAAAETPQVWRGNAAGLCTANLSAFQTSLSEGVAPLHDLAGVYRRVAVGVHDNAELMSTAVSALFDYATESIVDVGTGGLLGAYEIGSALHNFIRALRLALHIADTLQDIVGAGFNVSDEAMHRLGIISTVVKMPAMGSAEPPIPVGP